MNPPHSYPIAFARERRIHAFHQAAKQAHIFNGDNLDPIAEGKDLDFFATPQPDGLAYLLWYNDLILWRDGSQIHGVIR